MRMVSAKSIVSGFLKNIDGAWACERVGKNKRKMMIWSRLRHGWRSMRIEQKSLFLGGVVKHRFLSVK